MPSSFNLPNFSENPQRAMNNAGGDGDELSHEVLCYCSDSFCKNETCSVRGGQCFHSVHSVSVEGTWEKQHVYGCAFPEADRSQLQCHGHLTSHRFKIPQNISCCDSVNFCNLDLEPELQLPPANNAFNISFLIIALSGCLIALIVVFILFYCFLKKWRSDKRKNVLWKDAFLINPLLAHRQQSQKKSEHQRLDPDSSAFWDLSTSPAPPGYYDMAEASSGSGSGGPTLIQTTIARQLQMVKNIGKGRYGEVSMARWRGEEVAVKVFFTTEEASWENEKEIYQSTMLRHENVLGFIAADIRGHQSVTEMLLVTDFHERGSLYDFLKREPPLSPAQAFLMAASAASGLAHLHMEFRGTQEKSAIAHRDIKSKNILVKRSGECAIADFGLAVRKDRDSGVAVVRRNNRVGTKRYMSPEVLSNNLNSRDFNGYTMADMYAFALVLWEIGIRTEETDSYALSEGDGGMLMEGVETKIGGPRMNTVSDDSGVSSSGGSNFTSMGGRSTGNNTMETTANSSSSAPLILPEISSPDSDSSTGNSPGLGSEPNPRLSSPRSPLGHEGGRPKSRGAAPYMSPFADLAPNDPSFEQMRKIVCVDRTRPPIEENWFHGENLKAFVRIIKECWRESPAARLNALRVKKDLKDLSDSAHKGLARHNYR